MISQITKYHALGDSSWDTRKRVTCRMLAIMCTKLINARPVQLSLGGKPPSPRQRQTLEIHL
jgi:hypothetical protein